MGRPKGSRNKRGYKLSLEAWNQRVLAPLKKGSFSKVFNEIVEREVSDSKFGEELKRLKLEFWKRTANSPALVLLDVASELYSFIQLARLKSVEDGRGVLNKQLVSATKALVDVLKELSRISLVSADKKIEFLQGKSLDDLSFEVSSQRKVDDLKRG